MSKKNEARRLSRKEDILAAIANGGVLSKNDKNNFRITMPNGDAHAVSKDRTTSLLKKDLVKLGAASKLSLVNKKTATDVDVTAETAETAVESNA